MKLKRGDQERASRDLAKKLSDLLEKISTIGELSKKKMDELIESLDELLLNVKVNREISDDERNVLNTNLKIFLKGVKKMDDPASIKQITDTQEPISIIISRLQTIPVLESRVGEERVFTKIFVFKIIRILIKC